MADNTATLLETQEARGIETLDAMKGLARKVQNVECRGRWHMAVKYYGRPTYWSRETYVYTIDGRDVGADEFGRHLAVLHRKEQST
jgi:hypothetical protein